jgi:hypothetical protein
LFFNWIKVSTISLCCAVAGLAPSATYAEPAFFDFFIDRFINPAMEGDELDVEGSYRKSATQYRVDTPVGYFNVTLVAELKGYAISSGDYVSVPELLPGEDDVFFPRQTSISSEADVRSIHIAFDTWIKNTEGVKEMPTCKPDPKEDAVTNTEYARAAWFRTADNKNGLVTVSVSKQQNSYLDKSAGYEIRFFTVLIVATELACLPSD